MGSCSLVEECTALSGSGAVPPGLLRFQHCWFELGEFGLVGVIDLIEPVASQVTFLANVADSHKRTTRLQLNYVANFEIHSSIPFQVKHADIKKHPA